jgi:protein-L-isoaspartate O-methyltransferase
MSTTVDNPFFARIWPAMSAREPQTLRRLREESLAGLTGRVLEVGAGTGTNFAYYPRTVTEVVAVEPERRLAALAAQAADRAPVPVRVTGETVEQFRDDTPFDAVVCALVLCSVEDPDAVAAQLFSVIRPGGELRYLEHEAGHGVRARMQKLADATIWPKLAGNCHAHRNTEQSIARAGFRVTQTRREWVLPAWAPVPVAEFTIGRAVTPA